MKIDTTFLVDTMQRLIATPSPVGYYEKIKPLIEEIAGKLDPARCSMWVVLHLRYVTQCQDPGAGSCSFIVLRN